MAEELMVKVEDVYKRYRLGLIGGGTLAGDLQSWWAKVRGKEDPNSKIGAKVYGKNETFYALNGISFEVRKGEALGIIGGNGAGKSTTLKLLSQVTAPTSGKIYLNGRVASMLEVGTGFHPELTGRENIYLNGAILGMTKAEIDAKIEEIIDFSECRQFIDTPVKRYSSGMYVKLAFSVAAHLDSEIMIMDEVLAVGDMAFQKKCINKMVDISKEEGRTILYVSHNMNTIRSLCDRCIVLNKGEVIYSGDVEEAINIYISSKEVYECKTHYEYTDEDRNGFKPNQVKILGLDILEKDHATFTKKDIISMVMHCKALKNFDSISVRFQLKLERHGLLGSTFLDKVFSVRTNESFDLYFELSAENFIPGKYLADVIIFATDGAGNAKAADVIPNGLVFEISDEVFDDYKWWRNPFGFVKFNNMVLIKKER